MARGAKQKRIPSRTQAKIARHGQSGLEICREQESHCTPEHEAHVQRGNLQHFITSLKICAFLCCLVSKFKPTFGRFVAWHLSISRLPLMVACAGPSSETSNLIDSRVVKPVCACNNGVMHGCLMHILMYIDKAFGPHALCAPQPSEASLMSTKHATSQKYCNIM